MKIGVCGDGQLALLLAQAARRLGHTVVVLGDPNGPCRGLATIIPGDLRREKDVLAFGRMVDVVTFEFEDVNAAALRRLAARGKIVRPAASTLEQLRDKYRQKGVLRGLSIRVPAFAGVDSARDVYRFAERHGGFPVVAKLRLGSYDGHGNFVTTVNHVEQQLAKAPGPVYVEQHVLFKRELAQVATRGRDGQVAFYPLVETRQKNGICNVVLGPITDEHLTKQARKIAQTIVEQLDYVGTMAIEIFEMPDGTLLVNELAPRVHNSGHWTIDGAVTSQFENHLRAVAGMPLEGTNLTCRKFCMVNILGGDKPEFQPNGLPVGWQAAAELGAHLHWYNKGWRLRRKLGHITVVGDESTDQLLETAAAARRLLRV